MVSAPKIFLFLCPCRGGAPALKSACFLHADACPTHPDLPASVCQCACIYVVSFPRMLAFKSAPTHPSAGFNVAFEDWALDTAAGAPPNLRPTDCSLLSDKDLIRPAPTQPQGDLGGRRLGLGLGLHGRQTTRPPLASGGCGWALCILKQGCWRAGFKAAAPGLSLEEKLHCGLSTALVLVTCLHFTRERHLSRAAHFPQFLPTSHLSKVKSRFTLLGGKKAIRRAEAAASGP